MKINYKITAIVLFFALIALYAWQACDYKREKKNDMYASGYMGGMHRMPDGSMMSNTSSMDGMMMDMLANMRGKTGTDLEKAFITEMIPHHQGAVDMAKMLLKDTTVRPELKAFAEAIIKAQEAEIGQMNGWLSAWFK